MALLELGPGAFVPNPQFYSQANELYKIKGSVPSDAVERCGWTQEMADFYTQGNPATRRRAIPRICPHVTNIRRRLANNISASPLVRRVEGQFDHKVTIEPGPCPHTPTESTPTGSIGSLGPKTDSVSKHLFV